jgi:hypothetical protein
MVFRADEASKNGTNEAIRYLVTRNIQPSDRERSEEKLRDLIDQFGPVVDAYPQWHPLVSSSSNEDSWGHSWPSTTPEKRSGYNGLDHTILLRNAFITCPYHDGSSVLKSVSQLKPHPVAEIRAEVIDVPLYMPNAIPILVQCNWQRPMDVDGTIPKSIAVPLFLEMEVPSWRTAKLAETWETMRPYILGRPSGSRSSLFVNQETGQTLKSIWNSLIYTGMYGPIKVG